MRNRIRVTYLVGLFLCLCSLLIHAQETQERVLIGDPAISTTGRVRVTGTIKGKEERDGLFTATIAVLGTNNGAITDANGKFELTISPGDYVFVVQFLGKKVKRVPVRIIGSGRLDITLEDESVALEEVTIEADGPDRNVVQISAGVNKIKF